MQYGNHMKYVWEANYCFTQMWTSANQGCFTERQSWTIFSTASLQCVRIPCRSSMQPSMYTWSTMHCKQDICIIIMQPSPTVNNFKILSKTSLLYKILAMNICSILWLRTQSHTIPKDTQYIRYIYLNLRNYYCTS